MGARDWFQKGVCGCITFWFKIEEESEVTRLVFVDFCAARLFLVLFNP